MASIKGIISKILLELKALEAAGGYPKANDELPGLISAGDRGSLLINRSIEHSIATLSSFMLQNDIIARRQYSRDEWQSLVRDSLGPILASIDLDDPNAADKVRNNLRSELNRSKAKNGEREYAVGCTLFESPDAIEPISIGPVLIEQRLQWLSRMVAERKVGKIMAKRIQKNWAGYKTGKRKNAIDQTREKDILAIIGRCKFVCSVKTDGLPAETGKQKAFTAARMALATIALAWEKPSTPLDGFRLSIDQNYKPVRVLTFEPGKITLAGFKLSHLPFGYTFQEGDWRTEARKLAPLFEAAGEVLHLVIHPTGDVSRPEVKNVLMQALLWFHEACREMVDAMSVVKFVAVLDGLACGNGEQEIRALLTARVGWSDNDKIYKRDDLTMKQAVSRLYGEGRSRTVHGTSKRLSHDWSDMRSLAETLARLALVYCLLWYKNQPSVDDPAQLRVP